MKTWEMIKELTENPGKKFISNEGTFNEEIAYVSGNAILFESTKEILDPGNPQISAISRVQKWKEIKKPVDFMTAVKSGKRVKAEHPLVNDTDIYDLIDYTNIDGFLYSLGNNFYSEDVRDIIQNGKFYIED